MAKIIIVSNTSWNLFNFRLELARSIKKNGFEVVLVAPYDDYSIRLSNEFKYHDVYMNNKGTILKKILKLLLSFINCTKK